MLLLLDSVRGKREGLEETDDSSRLFVLPRTITVIKKGFAHDVDLSNSFWKRALGQLLVLRHHSFIDNIVNGGSEARFLASTEVFIIDHFLDLYAQFSAMDKGDDVIDHCCRISLETYRSKQLTPTHAFYSNNLFHKDSRFKDINNSWKFSFDLLSLVPLIANNLVKSLNPRQTRDRFREYENDEDDNHDLEQAFGI